MRMPVTVAHECSQLEPASIDTIIMRSPSPNAGKTREAYHYTWPYAWLLWTTLTHALRWLAYFLYLAAELCFKYCITTMQRTITLFRLQVFSKNQDKISSFVMEVNEIRKATFALSWFWFPEAQFGCANGVISTRVGYTGGTKKFPTYRSLWVYTAFGNFNKNLMLPKVVRAKNAKFSYERL